MEELPDQHHINHIRQRLWLRGEYGQASVMIGAGFSLNAQKSVSNSPDFPLWWPLAKKKAKAQNIEPHSNALSLAAEYEASFGREALDQFLLQIIPDNQHSPGKLHQLIMDLPWADIYTTNYDTLLERTTQYIHDRKYDVIASLNDM